MSLTVEIRKDLGGFVLDTAFETEQGITCLLGASGCGKSMTLKCIAGILKPDRGHIELNGRVLFDSGKHIDLPPQKRNVGYLFQSYALFPNMTVGQNILCGLHRERDRRRRLEKKDAILKLMRLEAVEQQRPAQLSGGQQQRAALGRILASEPEMLMLDEPFSALDANLRDLLRAELRDLLLDYGREVLMVTHSRDEAYTMSSRIGVMDAGRLLTLKPTRELFADPESIQAASLTGCKNIAPAERRGARRVYVPEWGVELETGAEVRPGLKAVGLRAHHFRPAETRNRFPVELAEEMEEPFETVLLFRFRDQRPGSAPLWWRLSRDLRPEAFPRELGIAPEDVLLLYA